ncbi:MAG: hypothetical protein SV487_13490 [Thermodesulfobacteriota bacterium]|nr:hypothetical protein [Thermodesulfobacteriota bacterium]
MRTKDTKPGSSRPALETVIIIGLSIKVALTVIFLLVFPDGGGFPLEIRPAYAQDTTKPESGSNGEAGVLGPAFNRPMTKKSENLIQVLRLREKELKKKEKRLDERAKALDALEQDLNKRLIELEATRKKLAALVKKNENLIQEQKIIKNARIEHLVSAYKSMKPDKAGTLIDSLDDNVAVRILSAMPGRNAGQILAAVNPRKAARLTKAISSMRQGAPEKEKDKPAVPPADQNGREKQQDQAAE